MKRAGQIGIWIAAPLVCMALSLFVGVYALRPAQVLSALLHPGAAATDAFVVLRLRLPRTLAAALCGAAMSASGAAYQGVFRNPLVNAGILGVSNGAGLGACVAIVLLGGGWIYPTAFAFGVGAVLLAWWAGRVGGANSPMGLVLGGVIVSAFLGALISVFKWLADPYTQLPAITFWLMGSFADVGYRHFYAFIPLTAGLALLWLARWRINALSMGPQEAAALGVDTRLYYGLVIGGATLASSAAVCVSGTVGWVGLVVPHIGRMLVGSNNRRLMPVSMSLGACFLTLMDLLARSLTGGEIPVGIPCAVVGAPFFVWLLKRTKGGAWL